MKYRYDGKESEWIDVSKDLMKKPSLTEPVGKACAVP